MKLTLATITNPHFAEALAKLAQLELPAKDAYSVAKIFRLVSPEAKDFDKARLAVLERYGKREGENYKIEAQEDRDKAEAELKELLAREIDLPVYPITLPDGLVITARDLMLLESILKPVEA